MPATFNGVAIFGSAVTMATGDEQRADQVNEYFGVSGREVLDGGGRGRVTQVSGVLSGADLSSYLAAVALVRSYRDGRAYVLVDTAGVSWPYVRMIAFNEVGRLQRGSGPVGFFRQYSATFEHLI